MNKKLKVLVTAIGGDIGQGVIKCLKKSRYQTYILGGDINSHAGGRDEVDEFMVFPPVKEQNKYLDFLLNLIIKKDIDYVFLLFEPEIMLFSNNRQLFKNSKTSFVVNEKKILDIFFDKLKTIEWFKNQNLAYPKTFLPQEYTNQLEFPLIIKQRSGSGGKDFFRIENSLELSACLAKNKDVIIQEYIQGDKEEYTAGIFNNGIDIYTICFKRKLAASGFSYEVELTTDENITKFLKKVGYLMNFKGSVNLQFRWNSKGLIPFEVNPRFSSTVYFRHFFGFRDVEWSIAMKEGDLYSYLPKFKKGIGVRKFTEGFFELEEL